MTHQERLDFCVSRNPNKPNTKIVKWLNRNSLGKNINYFLSHDNDSSENPFRFPNDYTHLYKSFREITVAGLEDFDYDNPAEFFYIELTDKEKAEITKLLGEDWEDDDYALLPGVNVEYTLPDGIDKAKVQRLREQIVNKKLSNLINDFDYLEGHTGYLDLIISLPSDIENHIPEYTELLVTLFEEKYPNVILRITFISGWDSIFYQSFGCVYTPIFLEIDDSASDSIKSLMDDLGIAESEDDEEEEINVWIPPRYDIEGHGRMIEDYEILDFDDEENNERLELYIDEFSQSPLYTDTFTSSDLIDFVKDSTLNIGSFKTYSYVPEEALTEALQNLIEEYDLMLDGGLDCRFIIYIGPDFGDKESLIQTAEDTIRETLDSTFENHISFKVAIAENKDLTGSGDLSIQVYN